MVGPSRQVYWVNIVNFARVPFKNIQNLEYLLIRNKSLLNVISKLKRNTEQGQLYGLWVLKKRTRVFSYQKITKITIAVPPKAANG